MADIFEQTILCKECGKKTEKSFIERNGFKLRAIVCGKCGNKILHPSDLKEYEDFQGLKKKHYKVKLRFVGNSYAVSIPREISDFMNEQERKMKQMVDLCFEEMGRLSLKFD